MHVHISKASHTDCAEWRPGVCRSSDRVWEVFDMWSAENEKRKKAPTPIPAPKLPLPGHAESYNPPAEYLQAPQPTAFRYN